MNIGSGNYMITFATINSTMSERGNKQYKREDLSVGQARVIIGTKHTYSTFIVLNIL
jgi:hypothetical protein